MKNTGIFSLSLCSVLFLWTCGKTASAAPPEINPVQAEKLLGNTNVLFLDVRTDLERASEQIPNSAHIPIGSLAERIGELSESKNTKIVVYCRSGNRSARGTAFLIEQGFDAVNLSGGMLQWRGPVNKK